MEKQAKSAERKWKRATGVFICLFIVTVAVCGFLLTKTDYPDRIATKFGWGGGYNPSGREKYLTKAWSDSLDSFDADVVFLGDSITAGGDWSEWFSDRTVCKLGVPGESLEQIMYRLDMVKKLEPQKVFLLAGVNNVSRGRYEETIREYYSLILQDLSEIECTIYVQSILPVREPSSVDNGRIDIANEIIEELAAEYECEFIDIHSAFIDENGEMKEELTKDGVHLNEDGYAVWLKEIAGYVLN